MASSAIKTAAFQGKIGSIQNQADTSAVYSDGEWSFKNSSAVASVTIKDDGNVGIGTASPIGTLTVGSNDTNAVITSGGSNTHLTLAAVGSAGALIFGAGGVANGVKGTERMRITASGLLYSLPTYNNTSGAAVNMAIASSGEFLRSTSALKYKEDITPISFGLDTVLSMQPIEYKSKCEVDKDAEHKFIGFVADWEEANLPALVQKDGEGEVEGFSYDRLTAVLCKAIQEQQAMIEELKAKVSALEAK